MDFSSCSKACSTNYAIIFPCHSYTGAFCTSVELHVSKVYVIAIICVFDNLIMVYSLFLAGVLCISLLVYILVCCFQGYNVLIGITDY